MLKGRKVTGRGETTTPQFAFGPLEDDIIIKHRLLTRTTTTRGDPPLKKLQKKFTAFVLEIEKEANNHSDCERLAKAFLQEMNTFEIPLLKSKAVIDANIREKENFNELKDEINRQILRAQADIEDLKKQLEESKTERQHKEEFDCHAASKIRDSKNHYRSRERDCNVRSREHCWVKDTGTSQKTICSSVTCGACWLFTCRT
ncbi:THO complex subunit 7A [Olea europaea subsp. europaea]|uniref:THO complex subunit 7A n=1 Tax=Olea europaea subsp. europaea TaxID=158383 RepID=A0A8S0UDT4_OLEEU|nr:THO complex subunit 7A [Olea europaea subsp. europaea]